MESAVLTGSMTESKLPKPKGPERIGPLFAVAVNVDPKDIGKKCKVSGFTGFVIQNDAVYATFSSEPSEKDVLQVESI